MSDQRSCQTVVWRWHVSNCRVGHAHSNPPQTGTRHTRTLCTPGSPAPRGSQAMWLHYSKAGPGDQGTWHLEHMGVAAREVPFLHRANPRPRTSNAWCSHQRKKWGEQPVICVWQQTHAGTSFLSLGFFSGWGCCYWEITMPVRHFKREVESLKSNEGLSSFHQDPAHQWRQECALGIQWRVMSPIHGDPSLFTGNRTRLEGDRASEEGWCWVQQKKLL